MISFFLPAQTDQKFDTCIELVSSWALRGYCKIEEYNDNYIWINDKYDILLHHRSLPYLLPPNPQDIKLIIRGADYFDLKNSVNGLWWARFPAKLEFYINTRGLVNFEERKVHSAAFFQCENPLQKQRRNFDFSMVVEDYFLNDVSPGSYTLPHDEYLERMSAAQYGLFARGFTNRDNRLVEVCALGMCPVLVSDSYDFNFHNEFLENVHYLRANSEEEFLEKTSDEKLGKQIAENAFEYWKNNWSIDGSWKILIDILPSLKEGDSQLH